MRIRRLTATMIGTVALTTALAAHATTETTITDLGVLPGDQYSDAADINVYQAAVGHSGKLADSGFRNRAVHWTRHGVITELGALPGDSSSTASAINKFNVVVGVSSNARTDTHRAVRWTQGGSRWTATALRALPGHSNSGATEIDYTGVIVGYSAGTDPSTSSRPVRWATDGAIAELPTPGHTHGTANAVWDGAIVGDMYSTQSGDRQAVRWRSNGDVVKLSTPPGYTKSSATGIQGSVVVGWVQGPDRENRAVRWTWDGEVTVLGTLPGYRESVAKGIAEDGTIVGMSYTVYGFGVKSRAVRWAPQPTMNDPVAFPPGDVGSSAAAIDGPRSESAVGFTYSRATGHNRATRWDLRPTR